MPLTRNRLRQHKVHQRALNAAPGKAGEQYFVGAYLVREAASPLAVPGTDLDGARPLGVIVEAMFPDDPDLSRHHHLDNRTGSDGIVEGSPERVERAVRYDQAGEYAFTVAAGTPLVGNPAFLVDDDAVSADATTFSVVAGWFTRPAPEGGWFIDIGKRGLTLPGDLL